MTLVTLTFQSNRFGVRELTSPYISEKSVTSKETNSAKGSSLAKFGGRLLHGPLITRRILQTVGED